MLSAEVSKRFRFQLRAKSELFVCFLLLFLKDKSIRFGGTINIHKPFG